MINNILLILIMLIILLVLIYINKKQQFTNNINKYILCYPLGGLSDMLCVINTCLIYAINNNRILILNTTGDWFRENIHKFIKFTHESIYKDNTYEQIYNLSIYPPIFNNKLIEKPTFYWSQDGVHNTLNNTILDTNLSKNYDEDIILYSNCGYEGCIPETLLKNMYFQNIVTDVYYERLNKLPERYISIHIRNTDFKSNVDDFIQKYNNKLKDHVFFLASDDINTIEKYKQLYGSNMFNFSNIPNTKHINDNANIHYNHGDILHEQFIIDCMVDILLLASGNEYYYSSEQSGYSKLALYLFQNKNILYKILNK